MTKEVMIFWRLPDGTRCAVLEDPHHGWRLQVTRMGTVLVTEQFSDPHRLWDRASALRPLFVKSVA
jgi:hypothetical protein